jgi:hypothetical protein
MTDAGDSPDFKDRRTLLALIGGVDILLGAIALLMVPLLFLGQWALTQSSQQEQQPMGGRQLALMAAMYGLLGIALVWSGVGLCLCRRWARALVLVGAWMGLVFGAFSLAFAFFYIPRAMRAMSAQQGLDSSVTSVITCGALAIMFVLYIAIPAGHVAVLSGRNAEGTCRRRDPRDRWTDALPLPLLAAFLLLLLGGVGTLSMVVYGPVFPFMGMILTGPPAWIAVAAASAVMICLAWGTYRRSMQAWWATLAVMTFWGVSSLVTFLKHPLSELYEKMGFSPQQLEAVRQAGLLQNNSFPWYMALCVVPWIAFLLFCRKYYRPAPIRPTPN